MHLVGWRAFGAAFLLWSLAFAWGIGAAKADQNIVSELRIGVLAHDVGPFADKEEDGVDFNAEILLRKPKRHALVPRPHAGFALNSAGDTNRFYGGFTWDFETERRLFIELGLGAVYHDGVTGPTLAAELEGRKALGCSVLIRGSFSIGYHLSERHNISLLLDHMSNATACQANEGSDSFGLRYGFRFNPAKFSK